MLAAIDGFSDLHHHPLFDQRPDGTAGLRLRDSTPALNEAAGIRDRLAWIEKPPAAEEQLKSVARSSNRIVASGVNRWDDDWLKVDQTGAVKKPQTPEGELEPPQSLRFADEARSRKFGHGLEEAFTSGERGVVVEDFSIPASRQADFAALVQHAGKGNVELVDSSSEVPDEIDGELLLMGESFHPFGLAFPLNGYRCQETPSPLTQLAETG